MTTTELTALLEDDTVCFNLAASQIEGHHPLCDLASDDGYTSVRTMLNNNNWWDRTVAEVAAELLEKGPVVTPAGTPNPE